MSPRRKTTAKDAATGEFVTNKQAERHPERTYRQTIHEPDAAGWAVRHRETGRVVLHTVRDQQWQADALLQALDQPERWELVEVQITVKRGEL